MKRPDLLRVAGRVAAVLGAQDCVLVGGMAVSAHGYVRATDDVDFVVKMSLAEARRRLVANGHSAVVARGDALEGDFACVQATVEGVPVDVLPALVPIDWDHAIAVTIGKRTLKVVDLDTLLRLKLRAGGPKDLMDVAALVLRHPDHEPRARECASAYGVAGKLDGWMKDPHLRAEARRARRTRAGGRRRQPSRR